MITIKLTLDKRRAKKDGSFPLVFRINCDRATRDIPTGYSLKQEHWDDANHQVLKSSPSNKIIAPRLKELESNYLLKIIEFERSSPGKQNIQEVRDYLTSTKKSVTHVKELWLQTIENLSKTNRHGGARVYKQALSVLDKIRGLDIPFKNVDYRFLKEVETALITRGVSVNGVGVYFRSFRAIYNQAIHLKLVDASNYPFKAYKIRKEVTVPRPLSLDEIRKYFQLPIDSSSPRYESWMIGKLIFLLAGINVADLLQLTKDNLKSGRVIYLRSKTKRMYSVKLLTHAQEIVSYFACKACKTLCGLLTDEQLENKARLPFVIHQRIKILNKHLKKISIEFGFSEVITTYTFRYTVANVCKQLGYDIQLIAELLGHSYGNRVTGIYLEAYDLGLIDHMNEKVCLCVMENAGGAT